MTGVSSWLLLFVCGVLETIWAVSTKMTDGFTNVPVTIFCLALAALNIFLLSFVFKALPIGIAYTICSA